MRSLKVSLIALGVVVMSLLLGPRTGQAGVVDLFVSFANEQYIRRSDGYTFVESPGSPWVNNPDLSGNGGGAMTLGPDGNLYISLHRIDRVSYYGGLDADHGYRIGTYVGDEPGSGPGTQPNVNLDGPCGSVFDVTNSIFYVVSVHHYKVLRYDTTSTPPSLLPDFPSQPRNPAYIARDRNGGLYVSDVSHDAVQKWNPATSLWDDFVSPGSGGLSAPWDLEFGSDGNLYVASGNTGQIMRYDGATGAPLPAPGNPGAVFASGGGLDYPMELAFRPGDNHLFVADRDTSGVLEYDSGGTYVGTYLAEYGPAGGLFFTPEPASAGLCAVALGALTMIRRRR